MFGLAARSQTPFSTLEFLTIIPQGQTSFSMFLANVGLPGENIWVSYSQYSYIESTGAILDLLAASFPLPAFITSNSSSSCLLYMVHPLCVGSAH